MKNQYVAVEPDYKFPFGKHIDKKIKDIPASYLLWLYDEGGPERYPEIRAYIEENHDELMVKKADEQRQFQRDRRRGG